MDYLTGDVFTGTEAAIYKRGKVVTIVFSAITMISDIEGWKTVICEVPDKYKPNYSFYFDGNDSRNFYMNNGKITSNSNIDKGTIISFVLTYVIK